MPTRSRRWCPETNDDQQDQHYGREPYADQSGRPIAVRPYRHNGQLRFAIYGFDSQIPEPAGRPARSHLRYYRRLRDRAISRYGREGRCSAAELRTIDALWIEGVSLREFARRENVRPQAISTRINGLANKAREFYRWWRRKNLMRQRG